MYQEVCFNRGTEAGGGELMRATRSAPPQSFYACYGPVKYPITDVSLKTLLTVLM